MMWFQEVNFGYEWISFCWVLFEAVRVCGVKDQVLGFLFLVFFIKVLFFDIKLKFFRVYFQELIFFDIFLLYFFLCFFILELCEYELGRRKYGK